MVTGAASGFGREAARQLDRRGEALALWDRDEAGLEATRAMLSGGRVDCRVVDVTDEEAVIRAAEASAQALGPLAHVLHSAGVLAVGLAEEVSAADYRRMIEVNYLGSVHMAQAMLPSLRAASVGGRATLTFVASVAGLRGFAHLAGYSASKFAVVGFAQALRDELSGTGVQVKVLCPPPGDTPMVKNLATLPPIYKLSPLFSARDVVHAFLDDLDRPGWISLVDLRSHALWRVGRFVPAVLDVVVRSAR